MFLRKIVICHSFHTMTTGRSGYKKAADPERPAAPFASFIPRIVFSVIRAFRFLHNLCFPEARGPFRSAKSTSGVCPLRPIFVSRIPCPPPTGSPSTYSNRSAGASPQSRREFPMPCEAAEQHSLVHRQAIFPLETLFELGDRARHFAYAAERIHRTISTDTPRSPF